MEFITNPWFYALAVPAALIVGFSKAGVGGGLGIMAVPMMALVDVMKLPAYALLGTLDATNLTTALILAPAAPLGIWLGVTFQKRRPEAIFYRIYVTLIFLTGCRLVWQGTEGLMG